MTSIGYSCLVDGPKSNVLAGTWRYPDSRRPTVPRLRCRYGALGWLPGVADLTLAPVVQPQKRSAIVSRGRR